MKRLELRKIRVHRHGVFLVPSHIQRIDIHDHGLVGTHGWQVRTRHLVSKFFSDYTQGRKGPHDSFKAALEFRLRRLPRPVPRLNKRSHADKKSNCPVGISFVQTKRPARNTVELRFKISVPRFGKSNTGRTVHISTRESFTQQKYQDALAKAIRIRKKVVKQYVQEFNKNLSGR